MPIRRLTLRVSRVAARWCFSLHDPAHPIEVFELAEPPDLHEFLVRVQIAWNDAALGNAPLAELLRAMPIPPGLVLRLTAIGVPSPGEYVVLVIDADAPFDRLPWEAFPAAWGAPQIKVVRLARDSEASRDPGLPCAEQTALLVACHTEPGAFDAAARREIDAVAQLLAPRLKCTRLEEPSLGQVTQSCARERPLLIHLISRARRSPEGNLEFRFPDERGETTWHDADTVAAALTGTHRTALVLLNVCGTGLDAAAAVARQAPEAIVLGWYGNVLSVTAADFALAFYSRLLAGADLFAALATERPGAAIVASVVRPGLLDGPPLNLRQARTKVSGGVTRGGGSEERDPIKLDLVLVPAICPALLVNGRSPVEVLRLTSPTGRRALQLQLSCDTGNGISVWRETIDHEPGVTPLAVDRLNFPVLHELVNHGGSRRQVNFTLSVSEDSRLVSEVTRSTTYLGPTEWLDQPGAWPYIPSYVLSDSDGAKQVVTQARPLLEKLGGGWFDGRSEGSILDCQVQALYETLRDKLALEYVSPPGAPIYVLDPAATAEASVRPYLPGSGQRVRFPNEVTRHLRGTCHDLALFFAACAEHVGIYSLVILMPGHTLFGYWRVRSLHRRFWEARRGDPTRKPWTGDRWVFTGLKDLTGLVREDAIRLVETTAVTRFGGCRSFQDACTAGIEHFNRHGRQLACVVDVWASREQVEPLYRAWTQE